MYILVAPTAHIQCNVFFFLVNLLQVPFKEEFITEMMFILKFEGNTKVVRHRKSESIDSQRSVTSYPSNESGIHHTGRSEKSLRDKWNGMEWICFHFVNRPVLETVFINCVTYVGIVATSVGHGQARPMNKVYCVLNILCSSFVFVFVASPYLNTNFCFVHMIVQIVHMKVRALWTEC